MGWYRKNLNHMTTLASVLFDLLSPTPDPCRKVLDSTRWAQLHACNRPHCSRPAGWIWGNRESWQRDKHAAWTLDLSRVLSFATTLLSIFLLRTLTEVSQAWLYMTHANASICARNSGFTCHLSLSSLFNRDKIHHVVPTDSYVKNLVTLRDVSKFIHNSESLGNSGISAVS